MPTKIALFNHKGGVSKTTTCFNLGWMLAQNGSDVIIVDTDSQCNLTGMVMGYKGPTELEDFYRNEAGRNLRDALLPAFESQPRSLEAVDCLTVPGRPNLFLLPGHIAIAEYEVTLAVAQELHGSIQALKNLPGAIDFLLNKTAVEHGADYVLIDMSPGLGALNQNLLSISDYFVVPTSPDFFSVMAIDSLARIIPQWREWAKRAYALPLLRQADYPFPQPRAKFLGTIVQKYRPRGGAPAQAFQRWSDEIDQKVQDHLIPALSSSDMLLASDVYERAGLGHGHRLATIPDFNSLIAKSQKAQTPVYALSPEQLGQGGRVLANTVASRDRFASIFMDLGRKIGMLTNAGAS